MTAQHTPEKTLMQGASEILDVITSPSSIYGSDFVEIGAHIDSRVFGDIKRAVNSHEALVAIVKERLASSNHHDADGIEYEWVTKAKTALAEAE